MQEFKRRRNTIWDWSTYKAFIPYSGERKYFNGIITGQLNNVSVLGNGLSSCQSLPFIEELIIHTSSNVDLEDLRVNSNRVTIYNTDLSTITIQIGTTGSPEYINLLSGEIIYLYFAVSAWININRHIVNSYNMGNLYKIPCDQVETTWTILNQSDLTWTDADFSSYVETGDRLKELLLYIRLRYNGNGTRDLGKLYIRPNGSSESVGLNCEAGNIIYTNLGSGIAFGYTFQHITSCDENGIIEYQVDDAATNVSMIALGYYLKESI